MYNKFLSISLLFCFVGTSILAMESQPNGSEIGSSVSNSITQDLDRVVEFIQATDTSDEEIFNAIENGEIKALVADIFLGKDNQEDAVQELVSFFVKNNHPAASNIKAMIEIELKRVREKNSNKDKQEQSAQLPKQELPGSNKNNKTSNFNGYKVGAVGIGSVAAFAVRDNLKNLVVGTYNRVKRATVGAKNFAVRSAVGLKNKAVYKDGYLSKTKLAVLGGTATVGVSAYVYNKKTNKIAEAIGNLSGKITTAVSNRYNGSDRAQAIAKFAQNKYANVSTSLAGYKDNVKVFFVKDKYHNTYVSIIAISGLIVLCKLIEKYFEKDNESAVTQLLVTFGDTSDNGVQMSPDLINLQSKMIAGIASGDVNTLISIKDENSDMLTADQQMLLDAAIEEIQNN